MQIISYLEIYQTSPMFSTVEYWSLAFKNFSFVFKSTFVFLVLLLTVFKSSIHFCKPSKLNVAHSPP